MDKKCSDCQIYKTLDAFCKDKSTKSGLNQRCKECATKKAVEREANGLYDKRRDYFLRYQKQYRKENPEKVKARILVKEAVTRGEIIKYPCIECGDENSTGHHPDYSKPLCVIWYCQMHHQREHARLKS